MTDPFALPWNRLGLIAVLAENAPQGSIGRTALMKFCYFLQTLRDVPLGYHFTLYSYGPFDSDVLSDLGYAEALEIVQVKSVQFPGGYGFEIQPGPRAGLAKSKAKDFLAECDSDIDWVLEMFGNLMAAELELTSTLIYADRELAEEGDVSDADLSLSDLARRVRDVKPHFNEKHILSRAEWLHSQGLLQTVSG